MSIKISLIKLLAIASIIGISTEASVVAQVEETVPDVDTEEVVPNEDIAAIVSRVDGLSTLESALEAADLTEALAGEGPFTVIAPVNDAFMTLPDGVLDALLLPENKDLLTEVLTYHVIPGEVMYDDLAPSMVETIGGEELTVTVEDDSKFVDGIQIVGFDVPASNGLIHFLQDGVLIPEDVATELETRLAASEEAEPEETVTENNTSVEPIRGLW